ncbi:hypothetical protein ACQZ4Q_23675 [Agrobacterium vitis]
MAFRAETVPPNLAEISLKHRKTKAFRSSKATDRLIFEAMSITRDKRELSMVIALTPSHTM